MGGSKSRLWAMYTVLAALCGAAIPDPTRATSYPTRSKGGSFKANRRREQAKASRRK